MFLYSHSHAGTQYFNVSLFLNYKSRDIRQKLHIFQGFFNLDTEKRNLDTENTQKKLDTEKRILDTHAYFSLKFN